MADSNQIDPTALAMKVGELIGARCALEIKELESNLSNRMDRNHREAMAEIEKVKEKQTEMAIGQARMEVRLEEGERRFEDLEARVSQIEEIEQRVVGLEQRELSRARESTSGVDGSKKKYILVGTGAVGAGGVWAVIEGLKRIFT